MCLGCSKEPSHRDSSFEYPQRMFWLRNKKYFFQLRTLILGPDYAVPEISLDLCKFSPSFLKAAEPTCFKAGEVYFFLHFMPPTLKKLKGHISVRFYVCPIPFPASLGF